MKPHYRLRVRLDIEGRGFIEWALEQPDLRFPKRTPWVMSAAQAIRHCRIFYLCS